MMMFYDDYDDTDSTSSSPYYGLDYYSAHTEHAHVLCNSTGMIYIHSPCAWTSAPLPRDTVNWNLFSQSGSLQFSALYYLSVKRVINWCPSLSPLYPILTAGILFVFLAIVISAMKPTSGAKDQDQSLKKQTKTKNWRPVK